MRIARAILVAVVVAPFVGCTSYSVQSRTYLTDLNYAEPVPGEFLVVKKNLTATAWWDSDQSPYSQGSEAYMKEIGRRSGVSDRSEK